jgi:hypothetical protein
MLYLKVGSWIVGKNTLEMCVVKHDLEEIWCEFILPNILIIERFDREGICLRYFSFTFSVLCYVMLSQIYFRLDVLKLRPYILNFGQKQF